METGNMDSHFSQVFGTYRHPMTKVKTTTRLNCLPTSNLRVLPLKPFPCFLISVFSQGFLSCYHMAAPLLAAHLSYQSVVLTNWVSLLCFIFHTLQKALCRDSTE